MTNETVPLRPDDPADDSAEAEKGWSDPPTVEQRRQLLELVAADGLTAFEQGDDDAAELTSRLEGLGGDVAGRLRVLPFVLQAICMELVHVSAHQEEHAEHHLGLDSAVPFLGAMVNGLMFDDEKLAEDSDDNPDLAQLRRLAARQGRAIRSGAGVPGL